MKTTAATFDGGQHGVDVRIDPGPDHRPRRTAALKKAIDHPLAELQHGG
ncbi:hypothetical protein [Streptomyces sp. W4I9-2]|nr:hypothetical protein [Streptomyces sp. W4I9-2]MDQ0701141.1 hypothetical protein [Streptomyces sp. W4I9-2]